jgi:hypothetical protein
MPDFNELVKNLYTSKNRELTPEKLDYITKNYSGKEEEFVKNFYTTINESLTEDKLSYIKDTYLKKKEPTTKDLQSGSPISTKPFDVFQTESNKKNTFNVTTGEVKPYVEPKEEKPKFDFNKIEKIGDYELRKKLLKEKVNKVESKGTDVANTLGVSLNDLYSGIAKTPRYVYELFSVPQNLISDITNSPKVKADYDDFLRLSDLGTVTSPFSPLTLLDRLGDYYNGEANKFKEKQIKYDNDVFNSLKNGDIDNAASQIVNNIVGSAPSIALMVGTSGVGNAAKLGAVSKTMLTALPFASSNANEIRDNKDIKDWAKPLASGLNGLSEVVLDQSFGASAAVNTIINKFKNAGVKEAEILAKDLAQGYLKSALSKTKTVLTPIAKGALEEGSTRWSQNLIKKISGENPNQDLMEGVPDAMIIGGVTTGSIENIGAITNPSVKSSVESKVKDIENLSNDLDNKNIPKNTKQAIENKINDLKEQAQKEIELNQIEFEKLPENKQEKAIELSSNLDAIEKSLQQTDLSDVTKNELEQQKIKINEELQTTLKPEENAIQKPSTSSQVSPTGETGQVITESGEGVRPSEQGKETTQKVSKEEDLKDVESTAKALDGKLENIPLSFDYNAKSAQSVSEAYHKAKLENNNPKLVEAVENLLGKEKTPTQQVEQLRADEQAELNNAIPNVEQYKTDGKVDRAKITDPNDLKAFDEIYDKYDKLITPLLEQGKTKALKSKKDVVITPDTSSNYANMTEDNKGNFVFFHVGNKGYDKIKTGIGGSTVTSREEASALSKVGGLGMYYTDLNQSERQSASGAKYAVKIPKEKVYDFNTDKLNFIEEAKSRHEAENPGKSFDTNSQLAYVTKIAGENGFDMVVAQWNGMTRAQTTKELIPTDIQESDGDVIKKDFNEKYESNKQKGFKPLIPVSKSEKLANVYKKINEIRNKENNYDKLYHLYEDSNKLDQNSITKIINESNLPQDIKDEYKKILDSNEDYRRSVKIAGKKVSFKNAPKGNHLNIGLIEGRTGKEMSSDDILSKLPKDVQVVNFVKVKGKIEETLVIETDRPLTDSEMIKLLGDTKQQAIPQLSSGDGILYDTERGTNEAWGEFDPEQFILQDGTVLSEYLIKNKTEVKSVENLNEDNLETSIELLDDIEANKKKASRASKQKKAELEEKIAKDEAELANISNEANVVKAINDNFDEIKKDLKDKGLLKINC